MAVGISTQAKAADPTPIIGTCAGKVWQYLQSNGNASDKEIAKATGESAVNVNRAIGWLSREGKVLIVQSGKEQRFRLTES